MVLKILGPEYRSTHSILLLSVAFMLIFAAFVPIANIMQILLESIRKDDNSFTGDGYTAQAIVYTTFSFSNWLTPSIVAIFKPKATMILGGSVYAAFIASFVCQQTWLLYVMSAILGFAAAALWTAQGNYLTICSNKETMSRNSGVFWAIVLISHIVGNAFVFWQFQGKTHIDKDTRTVVFAVFTFVCAIGVIFLFFLPKQRSESDDQNGGEEISIIKGATTALINAFKLSTHRNMLLLFFTFAYSGLTLCFIGGIHATSIGFTEQFGTDAKKLVGLCGIFTGVGGVIGGTLFGILGSKTVKYGRDPIVLLGFLVHSIAFYLIYLNLPGPSPLGPTSEMSYLKPPLAVVAMLCAFTLGFGEACFTTQIYSILGGLYPNESAPAFALFKFSQSAAAAASFFITCKFSLRTQLVVLELFCFLGAIGFIIVEWGIASEEIRSKNRNKRSIKSCVDVKLADEDELKRPL